MFSLLLFWAVELSNKLLSCSVFDTCLIGCMQAKAMQQGPDTKAAANGNSEPALPGANFGPKYEAHVSEMQNKLDEASKK